MKLLLPKEKSFIKKSDDKGLKDVEKNCLKFFKKNFGCIKVIYLSLQLIF